MTATRLLPAVLLLAAGAALCAPAPCRDEPPAGGKRPKTVLLIRHAEKTGEKTDPHLSKKGQERAEVLPKLFEASKERPEPFPTPDFIFAAANEKNSQRPVETVTPLSKKIKLPINESFGSKAAIAETKEGMTGLRDTLFGDAKYTGKTVLISWRHSTLPELARTLKADKAPEKWEDEVFDRVWQITYDEKGAATFRDRPQRLLPGDSEK